MTTSNKEVASQELKADALRFRYGIESKKPDGPRFDESAMLEREDEELSTGNSNRGNKCLFNSDDASLRKLNSSRDSLRLVKMNTIEEETGRPVRKLVLQDKRLSLDNIVKNEIRKQNNDSAIVSSDSEDDNDIDDNGNSGEAQKVLESIDLESILGPIKSPSDVVDRKSIRSIYTSKHLAELAEETIGIIEHERDNVNSLTKLMNQFLGDDPANVTAEGLKLPDYDHHLDLNKEISKSKHEITTSLSKPPEQPKPAADGSVDDANNEGSHVVDNTQSNRMISDPFFQLPQYKKDFNFGIKRAQDAEETRQLVQIALQRNEEFIRSLSSMRMGFIKADRLKNEVFRWCQELDEQKKQDVQALKEDGYHK